MPRFSSLVERARISVSKLAKLSTLALASLTFVGVSHVPTLAEEIDFERDIAPIFEERCTYCHGEDEQESGLRLDLRVEMLEGGDSGLAAIVPGNAAKSYLLEVVKHLDPDVQMPPDEEKIPQAEIELLELWIAEGAQWPGQMDAVVEKGSDHWSFQPVVRPSVPPSDSENPIDAFLLRRLSAEGLGYSQPAVPRSLLRRLSIVLTGLTPSLEEAEEFARAYATDPDGAYQAAVERLLDSPHFGERWAQHWLDVIRWAETNGSEANLYRKNAWVYRDYVIRSFNEDKPYDQFVREQIAGDSYGVGEATGFLVAGPHVPAATVGREPAAIRQARADRMDEIMQTVGASVLGVTIGCARCHNHKFDDISIRDYYAMTAVFQDVEFGSRHPEYAPEHPLQQRGEELRQQIETQRNLLREFGGWEENWGAYREMHFRPITTQAVRVRFKTKNVTVDELELSGPDAPDSNLALASRGSQASGFPALGVENRNPVNRINDGQYGTMTWRGRVEDNEEEKPWLQIDFPEAQQIDRLRLSSNREYFYDTDYLDKKPFLPRYEFDLSIMGEDGQWKPWVGTWMVNKKLNENHPDRKKHLAKIQSLINLLAEEGPRPSFVGRFVRPGVTHVLLRGSPESPRDEVRPAGPASLNGELELKEDPSGSARRRSFAEWISKPDHPLTARVMVNRIWHHIFGSGIVTTTSDFGGAGAAPSHPELLDWLAAEFVEPQPTRIGADGNSRAPQPWSTKDVIRLLVTSDAFKQASAPTELGMRVDAGTSLLWRFPPRRVEAEVIRDTVLMASGSLDASIGGRGYRIHNEKKTYAQWEVVNNYGPETWRRMLYQERMRRVDDQMFTAFDFPDCGQVRAKRPVSTTPLQALNLMNSPFVMEQSALIAERARQEAGGELTQQVRRCFELLLGREPDEQEAADALLAAKAIDLTIVCRALINSNEFAFLP